METRANFAQDSRVAGMIYVSTEDESDGAWIEVDLAEVGLLEGLPASQFCVQLLHVELFIVVNESCVYSFNIEHVDCDIINFWHVDAPNKLQSVLCWLQNSNYRGY